MGERGGVAGLRAPSGGADQVTRGEEAIDEVLAECFQPATRHRGRWGSILNRFTSLVRKTRTRRIRRSTDGSRAPRAHHS